MAHDSHLLPHDADTGREDTMSLKWIPNALTLSRCFAGGLVIWGLWNGAAYNQMVVEQMSADLPVEREATLQQLWYQFALLTFVFGALTDFVDGWAARKLNATSRFGVWLDPIADKVLVGLTLLGLCVLLKSWLIYLPAAAIIGRDLFMTWFRTTPRGNAVVDPSNLAKWKTGFEMIAIIGLMLPFALWRPDLSGSMGAADAGVDWLTMVFVGLLWIAAMLSVFTCTKYMIAANRQAK